MRAGFLLLVVVLLAAAAVAHSWLGERQVVRPVLELSRDPSPRLGRIVRIAWHGLSVCLLLFAAVFGGLALSPPDAQGRLVVAVFSASFFLLGVSALIAAGPRHIAWPLLLGLSAASALALV